MTVAIMQPYVFPYIGYFQLIHVADKFVFYDDVNFIKQGWINRNRILINGRDYLFTIPVGQISSFTEIKDTRIDERNYPIWRDKFIKSVTQSYKKAPYYRDTVDLVLNIFRGEQTSISTLAQLSVTTIANYLQLTTAFDTSSTSFFDTKGLDKADRLIEISKRTGAEKYVNPIGGIGLYDKMYFLKKGVQLHFIKTDDSIVYKQSANGQFIPWLSIIDILMFNSVAEVHQMLNRYELV